MIMRWITVALLFAAASLAIPLSARQPAKQELPRVVLIGDSIRIGYAPLVARKLQGKAVIISPESNGGDSGNVLKNLDAWVIGARPDVVHLNCGLHDLKLSRKTNQHQVALEQYERNLRRIVERIRKETSAGLVFASTTPILDDRHAQRKADFDRFEADVKKYNATAARVMAETGVTVHDLHRLVAEAGAENLLGKDGTHYTAEGYERMAAAVADCILRQLAVKRYRPLAVPAGGAAAASAYRKNEVELDGKVPARYRDTKAPEFRVPATAQEWSGRRPEVHKRVVESLGDLPERPNPPRARVISFEIRPGYTLQRLAIDNGVDGEVSALLLIPEKRRRPLPAILWLHSSTPDKDQVITPNTNGGAEPLGEVFVRMGFVVLAPDAYWHGDRVGTGPAGAAESGRAEQESLFKYHLWMGRTLWGMFVRDDQVALDYLCSRPEVDRARIGATGISMGSTRAWWLAAVDDRVAAVVGVACLTRYQNLIAHGQLRQHGVYYFVNGLLRHFDIEGVIALIAPRPYLALTGDLDAGSPADGIRIIEDRVGRLYAVLGAEPRFKSILYPGVGHTYTPEMRAEMLAWFQKWLRPGDDSEAK
jgi:lysophospholipase L1-like esterase/dienelactone hydrolase